MMGGPMGNNIAYQQGMQQGAMEQRFEDRNHNQGFIGNLERDVKRWL